MPKTDPTFGMWLKQRRKVLDLTQQGLANLVGCSAITIRKIEADNLRPSTQIAARLAACCNVPAADHADFVRFARAESNQAPLIVDQGPVFVPDSTPHNLMEPPTPLVDREHERAYIAEYLSSQRGRLLTLIGPPGVGKSRLALEVAFEMLEHFQHGVYFVSLAPVTMPQHVLAAIAQTINVHETGRGSLLDELKAELYAKKMLIVLDNFEQVLGAARYIDELLAYCPGLKFLVTSREVLRSRRERRFPVTPLPVFAPAQGLDLDILAAIPAVALFVERAQASNPYFDLNAANAADVVSICQQLGGLPLSIELIAARSMLLSPRAMLDQLTDQLSILNNGSYDHPPRQRTLRDSITWSFDLLEDYEQRFLARLGVFPDSASLTAIEAICIDDETLGRALDNVSALVDKSLVIASGESDGELRFGLLQVIQEYAIEQLESLDESRTLRERHARFYLELAEAIHKDLPGDKQQRGLAQLERELHHFRAALHWLLAHDMIEESLRLASALSDFWSVRGYSTEGRNWLQRVLAAAEGIPINPAVWIEALNAAGFLAYHQSDYAQARALFTQSLKLIDKSEDKLSYGRVTHNLALIDIWHGEYASAIALFEQSLGAWRTTDIAHGIGHAVMNLGMAYLHGSQFDRAAELFDESMQIWKSLGIKRGRGLVLLYQSQLALIHGAVAQAQTLCQQAYQIHHELKHQSGMAFCLITQAQLHLRLERFELAEDALNEALAIGEAIYSQHIIGQATMMLGQIALECGAMAKAEQSLDAALKFMNTMHYKAGLAATQRILALLALRQGRLSAAQSHAETSLAIYGELHHIEGLAVALETLALLLAHKSEYDRGAIMAAAARCIRSQQPLPALPLEQTMIDQTAALLAPHVGDRSSEGRAVADGLLSPHLQEQAAGI